MVVNGPEKHPGAVAVEDEFGRVISLATFNQQVTLPAICVWGQGIGGWGTGGLGVSELGYKGTSASIDLATFN